MQQGKITFFNKKIISFCPIQLMNEECESMMAEKGEFVPIECLRKTRIMCMLITYEIVKK
jgi:hypothetical protein